MNKVPANAIRLTRFKYLSEFLLIFMLGLISSTQAIACHKGNPHGPNGEPCNGGTGGNAGNEQQIIGVHRDISLRRPKASLWAPTDALSSCVLQKNSGKSLSGAFPRHELCASLPDDASPLLRDDIIIIVHTTNRGVVLGVEVQGQDWIGSVGLVHISEVMVPNSVGIDSDGNLVIHVHSDNVPLYQCDTHVLRNKSLCDVLVGHFALHDLVYSPDP